MPKRTITGYSATWDLDLGGDQIQPGAFAKSIAAWKSGEREIALVDTHDSGSVRNVLGRLVDAKEDDIGLLTTFELIDGDDATEALYRVEAGAVRGLSIGYLLPKGAAVIDELTGIRTITEVDLEEVSLVLFPMNPHAIILSIGEKAVGRSRAKQESRPRARAIPRASSRVEDEDELVDAPDMAVYNALMRRRQRQQREQNPSAFDDLPAVSLGINDFS